MDTPFISVIIPVYNCEKYIKYALESVFNQRYPNLEVIVINDGSTDRTLEILQQLNLDIKIISQENKGAGSARNTGLKASSGTVIAFLDSDDLWVNNHIECMLPYLLESSPEKYDSVKGQIKLFKFINNEIYELSSGFFLPSLISAGLYKASVFEKIGFFDEKMLQGEDTDWIIRFNLSNCTEKRITETTLMYRRHETNLTNSKEYIKKSVFGPLRKKIKTERNKVLDNNE